MVVLSEVTGKREKGEKAFAAIPVRYNALKKKVADSTLGTPSVMLNVPYGDSCSCFNPKLCSPLDY